MSDLVLRVGAKALIRYGDKFLLLREGAADGTAIGKYQIPGGMVELGEPFMDALVREVKEETGLNVRPVAPIMVDGWLPTIESVKHQIIAVFYLCEADTDKVMLSREHDDYKWIKPEEVDDLDVPHPVPQLFKKYTELSSKNWGEL
jgi:8-oxo-dGTP diphosphatase